MPFPFHIYSFSKLLTKQYSLSVYIVNFHDKTLGFFFERISTNIDQSVKLLEKLDNEGIVFGDIKIIRRDAIAAISLLNNAGLAENEDSMIEMNFYDLMNVFELLFVSICIPFV